MTVALRGLGAPIRPFVDTGAGITPANFKSKCCSGWLNWLGYLNDDACYAFANVNKAMFGPEYNAFCSKAGLDNLTLPLPVGSMAQVPTPVIGPDWQGKPTGDVWSYPYSDETPACNGRQVLTEQAAADLVTCLAQRQAATQRVAVMESMTANAAGQCAAMKVECANRVLADFLKVNEDCTDCVFSWGQNSSIFLVGGAVILGLVLLNVLKR